MAANLVYSPIYDMMVPGDLLPPSGFADNVPGYLGYTGPTTLIQKVNPLQMLGGGYLGDADYVAEATRQGFSAFDIGNAIRLRNNEAALPPPIPNSASPWMATYPMATVGSPQPPIPIFPPDAPHPLQPTFFVNPSVTPGMLPTPGAAYSPTRPMPSATASLRVPLTRGPVRSPRTPARGRGGLTLGQLYVMVFTLLRQRGLI